MSFESLTNQGEFFSNHYLDEVIAGHLGDIRSLWDEVEGKGAPTSRSRLKGGASEFFTRRAAVEESSDTGRAAALQSLHDHLLATFGYESDRIGWELKQNTEHLLDVPIAARIETSTGLLLVAIEAGNASSVDDLFGFEARAIGDGLEQPGQLLDRVVRNVDKRTISGAVDAVGEIFGTDEPPRYVLVLAGAVLLLAERAKWADGRYLAVDLGLAFDRNDSKAKGELETIAALFSYEALTPTDGQSTFETLVENSHKHAVGVSKELRNGIRASIEIIANEVIAQRDERARRQKETLFTRTGVDARDLTRQALRYLYRLIVLLYAESRPRLGIVPVDDEAYIEGYSLDRLRELCLVELENDHARNGTHFQQSLDRLFELVNDGYHAEEAEQQLLLGEHDDSHDADRMRSEELYIQFPGLDAQLFDPVSTSLINEVSLRNEALQRVLRHLMLATGSGNNSAGFISYTQLGINQLGAVYEGLMAYTGFYADTDLYEVAKNGDPKDGTWMLPAVDADDYPDDVFVTTTDEFGKTSRVLHEKGTFVFRLSGRDRQRSASYYTPEVLTQCVVKHALAELLGLDDYAPERGSSGIVDAFDLLDLTICEPALGSGAFANEAINQLATEYLRRRQAELGEVLDPSRYHLELQKVKAHFALHQTYGVDLNATAVELAEVSLWLNAMYPGLKAPWFGLQLRRGNSLIGCRRATWKTSQLGDRPWANTKKGTVQPPIDRKLSDGALDPDEIHHFLLPGHGWAAVADRKEAKELRPGEVQQLRNWRKKILAAPKKTDAKRLTALAEAIEVMWQGAAERIRLTQLGLRRPIDVYGATIADRPPSISRAAAEAALSDPDSPLGRLRTLMHAWVGLWFWPLDTGIDPPSWGQWLQVAEELCRPDERHGLTGQLDLFDHLTDLLDAQQRLALGQATVAELAERHEWLAVALSAAEREGAWHWELEFAPAFQHGGFDLQVGNPPWVRPRWNDELVLAEVDPWWVVTTKPNVSLKKARRSVDLAARATQDSYLRELVSAEGSGEVLGSAVLRPVLVGVQTNLYMVFMDTTWLNMRALGAAGLLHPESHFSDPNAGVLRRETYAHLRRHWQFNELGRWFEEVPSPTAVFGANIYGQSRRPSFLQVSNIQAIETLDGSIAHDGVGPLPAITFASGQRDKRPHRERVIRISEDVLADWARLFDEPGTPAKEARLLRPVTSADLEALSVLASQPVRLADRDYKWTRGHEEDRAKADGTIRWQTAVPTSWEEVILQGPHYTVSTPFAKQPNENCKSKNDYSEWDLESLEERVVPRTNYQRACDRDAYYSRLDHWNGVSSSRHWRVAWRAMTQPTPMRSFHTVLLPAGPAHTNGTFSIGLPSAAETVLVQGLWASIVIDYLVKVAGTTNLHDAVVRKFPVLPLRHPLSSSVSLRALRLNCLTGAYAPLWDDLFQVWWQSDAWTEPGLVRSSVGRVESTWSMETPLRRDQDRWQALVELDALAALMLGLTAEQLCAMYRTQFAVLRKYEYKMVFDAEGRKICGYHQGAGFRQSALQDQAKAGELPDEWKNLWKLYEQYEDDPESVDWLGQYTEPFVRVDREASMTQAYHEFQRRLDAGEYGSE